MKKNLSKIVLLASLIVGLSSYTSNAQTVTKSEDLDMDGKTDNIVLTVEKDAFFGQLYKSVSINGKSFDLSQYNANKFSVLDINSKDKQKEIVFTSMGEDSMGDAYIFTYKNKNLEKIGNLSVKGGDLQVNTKLNRVEIQKYTNFASDYVQYYEKYTIENGKLKNITPDEKNLFSEPHPKKILKYKMSKSLNTFSDAKMKKAGETVKPGEIITILAFNTKADYFKIKTSSGKIGYVPIVITGKEINGGSIKALKQYEKDYDKNNQFEVANIQFN